MCVCLCVCERERERKWIPRHETIYFVHDVPIFTQAVKQDLIQRKYVNESVRVKWNWNYLNFSREIEKYDFKNTK